MLLILILVIILVAVLPSWPYSRGWGPYPGGIVFVLLIVLIVLLLTGRL